MPAKPIVTQHHFPRTTLAQIERSLRAAKKQGTPARSITHHPDGRVVISLQGVPDEPDTVNEWDKLFS